MTGTITVSPERMIDAAVTDAKGQVAFPCEAPSTAGVATITVLMDKLVTTAHIVV